MDWKDFEELIEHLARKTAPDAIVRRNVRRLGRSGVLRQLDVVIQSSFGLMKVEIVVECKKHGRKVSAGDVEKFAGTVHDVRATGGIMISASGFTSGAQRIAKERNVQLLTYRGAREEDQTALLGQNAHFFMVVDELEISETTVHIEGEDEITPLTLDEQLEYEDGSDAGDVRKYRNCALEKLPRGLPLLGPVQLEVTPQAPLFLVDGDGRHKIRCIGVAAVKTAKVYSVPVTSTGHVLEDAESQTPRFRELSHEVNWRAVCDSQAGREISLAEYLAHGSHSSTFESHVNERDGLMRINLVQREPPGNSP